MHAYAVADIPDLVGSGRFCFRTSDEVALMLIQRSSAWVLQEAVSIPKCDSDSLLDVIITEIKSPLGISPKRSF